MTTILQRHIFFNLLPPFAVNLLFFVVISLLTDVLTIVNTIVNYHVSPAVAGLLLLYNIPSFLIFIIPMSVMMSVLLTFLRMSADNEITALKSCGIATHRLLAPVLAFALLGWGLTTYIEFEAMPMGKRAHEALFVDVAQKNIDAIIQERTFIDTFEGVVLYISQVDMQSKSLVDVFIEDRRTPGLNNTITAPRGRLALDADKHELHLMLYRGTINQVDLENRSAYSIAFDTYEFKLNLGQAVNKADPSDVSLNAMTPAELRVELSTLTDKTNRYYRALIRYYEKFAIPFACLSLGILALPLGMVAKRSKRSSGIVMGIVMFLAYFILISVGWSFGESGSIHPLVGMWAPNVVIGGLGIYLYRRASRDLPLWSAPFGRWRSGKR